MKFASGVGSWSAGAVLKSGVQILCGGMEDRKQPAPGTSGQSVAENHMPIPGVQHEGGIPSVLLHSNSASMPGSTAPMRQELLMQHAPRDHSSVPQQIVVGQESHLLKIAAQSGTACNR